MDILNYFLNELQLNNCIKCTEKYIRDYPEEIEDQRHVIQKIGKQKKYHQV